MDQTSKELLLKDLCARLPYGVICHYDVIVPMVGKVKSYDKLKAISEFDNKPCFQFGCNREIFDFDNVKPYLFPLSSMTEEQNDSWRDAWFPDLMTSTDVNYPESEKYLAVSHAKSLDWLYKNHIDIYGLIPKGLAIDATGLNVY